MPQPRLFRVHAGHLDAHHAITVPESSFEAAAVSYVEDLHDLPPDGAAIVVIVREVASGRQHCFMVDVESGETAACA